MRSKRTAWVVGGGDGRFHSVLRHVLRELGIGLQTGWLHEDPPDLVLVAVENGHLGLRLAAARHRARGAPVVALLPSSDFVLAGRALADGAHAVHALDTSMSHLRRTLQLSLEVGSASRVGRDGSRDHVRTPARAARAEAGRATRWGSSRDQAHSPRDESATSDKE